MQKFRQKGKEKDITGHNRSWSRTEGNKIEETKTK
jgi:hypothetical protein